MGVTFSTRFSRYTHASRPIFIRKKHISESVAQLTVIILATNLLFFGSSQYINHDLLLASWITISVLCFVDFTISARKSILFLGYIAGAAAFLSKGLIGILIPGMILLPWLIYTKQWKKIPSLLNPLAILLFLLIVSPWLYLVQSKYPQFLHYFLLINNLIVLVQKSLITNSHGVFI